MQDGYSGAQGGDHSPGHGEVPIRRNTGRRIMFQGDINDPALTDTERWLYKRHAQTVVACPRSSCKACQLEAVSGRD